MEFFLQYDASINYILGEKDCVADALSCLPETCLQNVASIFSTSHAQTTFSRLELDTELLKAIRMGYKNDPFIAKLTSASAGMSIIHNKNDYWFISEWLMIPNVKHICKSLFRLAHDTLGHFSSDKSLASLRGSFYWPNMQCGLKMATFLLALTANEIRALLLNRLDLFTHCPSLTHGATQSQLTLLALYTWTRVLILSSPSLTGWGQIFKSYPPILLLPLKNLLTFSLTGGTVKMVSHWTSFQTVTSCSCHVLEETTHVDWSQAQDVNKLPPRN